MILHNMFTISSHDHPCGDSGPSWLLVKHGSAYAVLFLWQYPCNGINCWTCLCVGSQIMMAKNQIILQWWWATSLRGSVSSWSNSTAFLIDCRSSCAFRTCQQKSWRSLATQSMRHTQHLSILNITYITNCSHLLLLVIDTQVCI